jgi:hypothetical protein
MPLKCVRALSSSVIEKKLNKRTKDTSTYVTQLIQDLCDEERSVLFGIVHNSPNIGGSKPGNMSLAIFLASEGLVYFVDHALVRVPEVVSAICLRLEYDARKTLSTFDHVYLV